MADPSHGTSKWGSDLEKFFRNGSKQPEPSDMSINSDGSYSEDSYKSDSIKDSSKAILLGLVSERKWDAVYDSLSYILKEVVTRQLHPLLYLNLYREHVVDLMLHNEQPKAHILYTDKVHDLKNFANSGFAVPSAVEQKVEEIFNIVQNQIHYQPTENAKMCERVDYYLRLYFPEIVGHDSQPGRTQCHLWQFVIKVPNSKPDQSNPSFRCLACGSLFKNCTISKYRDHMTEDKKGKKKKKGKFPMCKFITMEMKLRYSLGERDLPDPKPAHGNANARHPEQALRIEGPAPAMHEGRRVSKEAEEKTAEGDIAGILAQQAFGGKIRRRDNASLEIDIQERKRQAVAKGSIDRYQEESPLRHLVTGVRSNVAAFNKLFGGKGLTLAVCSDLNVARDMLCKMIKLETVAALVSGDELLDAGCATRKQVTVASDTVDEITVGSIADGMVTVTSDTVDEITVGNIADGMRTIPCTTQELEIEEGRAIHALAALVRQSVGFLSHFYKKENLSPEIQRELLAAKDLLSRLVPCQKK
ncbi:unnamed protein product [Urochloa humidicola]